MINVRSIRDMRLRNLPSGTGLIGAVKGSLVGFGVVNRLGVFSQRIQSVVIQQRYIGNHKHEISKDSRDERKKVRIDSDEESENSSNGDIGNPGSAEGSSERRIPGNTFNDDRENPDNISEDSTGKNEARNSSKFDRENPSTIDPEEHNRDLDPVLVNIEQRRENKYMNLTGSPDGVDDYDKNLYEQFKKINIEWDPVSRVKFIDSLDNDTEDLFDKTYYDKEVIEKR